MSSIQYTQLSAVHLVPLVDEDHHIRVALTDSYGPEVYGYSDVQTNAFEDQRILPTLILPTDSVDIDIEEQLSLTIITQETFDDKSGSALSDLLLAIDSSSSALAVSKDMTEDVLGSKDDIETVLFALHFEDSLKISISRDISQNIPSGSDHEMNIITNSDSTTAVKSLSEKPTENTPIEIVEKDDSLITDSTELLFDEAVAPRFPDFSPNMLPSALLIILLFPPWYVLVVATILLSPQHLKYAVFFSVYIASSQGVRRFAHRAEVDFPHVMIFFAFIRCIGTEHLLLGITLGTLTIGQSIIAWHDFHYDSQIPVGDDDRQSLYLITVHPSLLQVIHAQEVATRVFCWVRGRRDRYE
ncbi:hypothetical protein EDD18DRAFT_1466316 [Armillaria luteobubalina]|uniref:Uncharacterized protein n=1 Tax=Armillaria luteobubalina TaxID=153913 RepID=A0AA39PQ15_9AGAR|nr:hypothetical protein EDD18DRAFT_1466316 [Armillaria luteobubalina]